MNRHGERGQSITFWAFAVISALGLSFFVMNFGKRLRANPGSERRGYSGAGVDCSGCQSQKPANHRPLRSEFDGELGEFKGRLQPERRRLGLRLDNAYDQEPVAHDAAVVNYATALRNLQDLNYAPAATGATPAPLRMVAWRHNRSPCE